MNEGFDMYSQIFEYKVLKSSGRIVNNWVIKESAEDIKRFTVDYVTIKDTLIEHVKEIHGYSLQKLGGKLILAEINIPLAKYNGGNRWEILKREQSEVLADMKVLWERDEE